MELTQDDGVSRIMYVGRPASAKFSDLQALRNARSRPLSAVNKNLPANRQRGKKLSDQVRRTSKKACSGKEELYDKAIELKNLVNELKEENMKLKTKIKTLERDMKRDENEQDKGHLVINLKNQCKDLHKQLDSKDDEIKEFKKSVRSTRVTELEVEMKVYLDECTRLRRLMEDTVNQLAGGVATYELQEKYVEQSLQIKKLNEEKREMEMILEEIDSYDSHNGKRKKEDVMSKLRKTLMEVKDENMKVNQQNLKIIAELGNLRQNAKCTKCNERLMFNDGEMRSVQELLVDLWRNLEHKRISLNLLWEISNPHQIDEIDIGFLAQGLEQIGCFFTEIEMHKLMKEISPSLTVTKESLISSLQSLRPPFLLSYSQSEEALTHLAMRIQIRRWSPDNIPSLFFQHSKLYSPQEFKDMLKSDPLSLSENHAAIISEFLFAGSEALHPDEAGSRLLECLPVWEVLTEAQEQEFDYELRRQLSQHGTQLISECKKLDKSNTGYLTFSEFDNACEVSGIYFREELKWYLRLLFYTDQMILNSVPYSNFLQAYSADYQPMQELESFDSEESINKLLREGKEDRPSSA